LMTPAKSILACDVGGTRIKLGIARGANLLAQTEIDAGPKQGLAAALRRIARETPALCRQAGVASRSLAGFGLSFPGVIEPDTERILSTPAGKFDDARDLDVPTLVADFLGLAARVCNDANAALAGERHFGAARGYRSVVMMTLGTGIGASAIIDGSPLRGQHGLAGCLGGHLTVNLEGNICRCGNIGCAETEASTWALPLQVRVHPNFSASSMRRNRVLDYAAVFRAAANGDPLAVELRDRSLRVWSVALVNLIHAYDPEIAVIGGGIMRSGKAILPALRHYVARHAWTPWGQVKINPAALGNNAGMLGVSTLFSEEK
jgi:glucokinase